MLWESLHFYATESTYGQGSNPADDEVRDVVVQVAHGLGHQVAAFEYPNLVGDVRTLPLKSAADNALHDLSCLVIFVLLFQQDFGPCTVHVELLGA